MLRLIGKILLFAIFLALASPLFLHAQTAFPGEKHKIEFLIKRIAQLKETKFVRNGSAYSSETAATFLRLKWQANDPVVKTARDFIDKVASFSGTSGKPYLIRMKDGTEVRSRDFLLAELKQLENTSPEKRESGWIAP